MIKGRVNGYCTLLDLSGQFSLETLVFKESSLNAKIVKASSNGSLV